MEVYNLILKDILIQKRTFIFALLYIPCMIIAFQNSASSMLPAGVMGMTYILLLTACASDDKYKTDILLNSLPLRRKNIVLARYVSIFVYFIAGTVIYIIFSKVVNLLGLPFKVQPVNATAVVSTLLAMVLFFGIYLPIFYRYGYLKSRTIAFLMFVGVFFSIGAVSELLRENQDSIIIRNVANFFLDKGDTATLIALLVIIIIFAGSYMLSVRFYNNRDF